MKLARTVGLILIASTLVVLLTGCEDLFEGDEEEQQRAFELSTARPNPTVTVVDHGSRALRLLCAMSI